jgi:hypothetical protein
MSEQQPATQDNVARLLKYLKDDSLAAQLVRAHRAPDGTARADAMKEVLEGRLKHVRSLANPLWGAPG